MSDERPLKPEEKKVWKHVSKTVTPRRQKSAKPMPTRAEFSALIRLPPDVPLSARPLPQSLDINKDKKVRRGRVEVESKIDLHDMTQDEAKPALYKAIARASRRNYRCVLVVTGKGLRLNGVLRRNFPSWIEDPLIRPLISTYAQAHVRHGGTGAWYVFLKSSQTTL